MDGIECYRSEWALINAEETSDALVPVVHDRAIIKLSESMGNARFRARTIKTVQAKFGHVRRTVEHGHFGVCGSLGGQAIEFLVVGFAPSDASHAGYAFGNVNENSMFGSHW